MHAAVSVAAATAQELGGVGNRGGGCGHQRRVEALHRRQQRASAAPAAVERGGGAAASASGAAAAVPSWLQRLPDPSRLTGPRPLLSCPCYHLVGDPISADLQSALICRAATCGRHHPPLCQAEETTDDAVCLVARG